MSSASDILSHVRNLHPAHVLTGPASPTADLYLGLSCAALQEAGGIRRLSATVFHANETLVVMRHTSGLRHVPKHSRLIFLADDDFHGVLRDRSLPIDYRIKLTFVEIPAARRFEPAADVIVTASAELAKRYSDRYRDKDIRLVEPAWPTEWLPDPTYRPFRGRIAMLAGRSHARDVEMLARPLVECIERLPEGALLTLSANGRFSRAVRQHPRVTVLPSLGWPDYLAWLKQARFDIAVIPHAAEGAFNNARSSSKFGEYAVSGAAIVAPDNWGPGVAAASEGRCVVAGPGPAAVISAIENLAMQPETALRLACRNRQCLIEADAPARQRAFWSGLLRLDNARFGVRE